MAEDEENLVKGDSQLNDNGIFITSRTFKLKTGAQSKVGFRIRSNTNLTLKQKFGSKWIQYLHVTILYLLVVVLYVELRSTKRNVYDFNLNMLNLSTKHMELELSCFRELETIRGVLAGLSGAATTSQDDEVQPEEGFIKQDIEEDTETARKKRSPPSSVSSDPSEFRSDLPGQPDNLPRSISPEKVELRTSAPNSSLGSTRFIRRSLPTFPTSALRTRRGINFVHLLGGHPESVIRDEGLIAPWFVDKSASGEFGFTSDLNLVKGQGVVEIRETGLYLIYAQVFYFTSSPQNSFSLMMHPKGNRWDDEGSPLSTCSAYYGGRSDDSGEISCFTCVARKLARGDRIYLLQRERNRMLLFREGKSFLGVVLLAHSNATQQPS
ncbi:hypothetical protein AAG570_002318 [Ranatra chinensis]|uniref:THD domain-containing protein n=1 Tax=Ranatra chinensis TaxID=642074 RepID=A0ABD0Y7N7_9HEMI